MMSVLDVFDSWWLCAAEAGTSGEDADSVAAGTAFDLRERCCSTEAGWAV